jgi:hypothetical protein
MMDRIRRIINALLAPEETLTFCTPEGAGLAPDSPLRAQYERMAQHQRLIEAEERACQQLP